MDSGSGFQGVSTTTSQSPLLANVPLLTAGAVVHKDQLWQAVQDLLAKEAIVQVTDYRTNKGFYSPYFTTPKKDGSLRPILNLKVSTDGM